MMSVFSEGRDLSYSPYLEPVISAEVRCVAVDVELECIDPGACSFLFSFARDNELTLRLGRQGQRPEPVPPALKPPVEAGGNAWSLRPSP
jgi:hypothetical protein